MIKEILKDDSAVSVSMGFILTFTITVLAMVMVMNTFFAMTDNTEHSVMAEQSEIYGNGIALQIMNIDTMANFSSKAGMSPGEIRRDLELPDKIAGQHYSVEFSNTTNEITFSSQKSGDVLTKVEFVNLTTGVESTTIYSAAGEHYLLYNPTTNIIEVH